MGASRKLNKSFQYLFDSNGKKSHLVVPIHLLEDFLAEVQDSREIKKLKKEPTISFNKFVEELKKNGKI